MDPVLLMGGPGAIGRLTATALRENHPRAPLLIGGRDRAESQQAAAEIGVALDPAADDLGLAKVTSPHLGSALMLMDFRSEPLRSGGEPTLIGLMTRWSAWPARKGPNGWTSWPARSSSSTRDKRARNRQNQGEPRRSGLQNETNDPLVWHRQARRNHTA